MPLGINAPNFKHSTMVCERLEADRQLSATDDQSNVEPSGLVDDQALRIR